uniref:Uncharacterized protein n=1 Tax=Musa acuminata subsp. malaccensis TaxID=214687 RepID=A0A804L5Z6_MUSAM
MGLIPDEQYEDLVNSCEGKYFGNSNHDCLRNLENFQWHIKDINKDHILCLPCHFTMGNNMVAHKYDSFRTYESIHGETQYSPYCHEYEMAPKRLLDLETSRQILHAMPFFRLKFLDLR